VTVIESGLLAALRELEAAVASMPSANPKPDLTPLFRRIDELARRLPPDADPDLRHYMVRQSWQKARLWLEAQPGANG